MRADKWQFRVTSLFIASVVSGTLWWLFHDLVNDLVFLLPFYWILYQRDASSRLQEIGARARMNTELLMVMVANNEDDIDRMLVINTITDRNGFEDDDDDELEYLLR